MSNKLKSKCFCALFIFFHVIGVFAMEQAPVGFTLPAEIDPQSLIQSSVLINYGLNRATGFAIGPKHIVTVAHAFVKHSSQETKIECAALNKVKGEYLIPSKIYKNLHDEPISSPNFLGADDLKVLEIVKIHFHPATRIEPSDEQLKGLNIKELSLKLEEVMQYGLVDAKKYAAYGVNAKASTLDASNIVSSFDYRVFGPDVAIIECQNPHGLTFLEIMDPTEERLLMHIVGLQGIRCKYDNGSVTALTGICELEKNGDCKEKFQPAIYGQRFKSCRASDDQEDHYQWMNRVFLKIIKNKFFLSSHAYPNAPRGFGLIAPGDSGSGVVAIKNGKAFLTGVVSSGDVESIFSALANLFENTDPSSINEQHRLYGLYQIYKGALVITERDKKWFITQSLTDLTHLKDWIDSIVFSDSCK